MESNNRRRIDKVLGLWKEEVDVSDDLNAKILRYARKRAEREEDMQVFNLRRWFWVVTAAGAILVFAIVLDIKTAENTQRAMNAGAFEKSWHISDSFVESSQTLFPGERNTSGEAKGGSQCLK